MRILSAKRIVLLLVALSAAVCRADSNVDLNVLAADLQTAAGALMPSNGLVVIVASTTNSTFDGPSADAFATGDDVVVFMGDIQGSGTNGTFISAITNSLTGNWNTGNPLQLYWFPTLATNATSPGAGTSYGQYSDAVGVDGSDPWLTPATGAVVNLTFLTTVHGGTNAQTAGRASLTIPFPAQLTVSPSSADFGLAVIGTTNSQSFAAINTGTLALTGTASVAGPFLISNGTNFVLSGGATSTVTVAFAPDSAGVFSNAVIFSSNGGDSTNSLLGAGLIPNTIGVLPSSHDFGFVVTGTTAHTTFVVTNTSASSVSGTATVSVARFSIVSGSPFTIGAHATTNVVVGFTPTNEATHSDNVLFTSTAGTSTNAVTGNGAIIPIVSFTGSPTTGVAPFDVTFTDTSAGTITNRFWSFGDGSTTNVNTTSVIHTYHIEGSNTVTLIASGPVGAHTNARSGYIVVYVVPVANFTASPTNGVRPLGVSFVNTTTGTATSFAWTFGDGGTSTNANPNHVYTNASTFGVTLTVSGPAGGSTNAKPALITVIEDTVPPSLTISSPTNSQLFTNSPVISVLGNATDESGIKNVKVNGSVASLIGTNWSKSITLTNGSNPIAVIATDNSASANASTQTITAFFETAPPGPADTNAPFLLITFPTNFFEATSRLITVTGHATDDVSIASVTVTNDRTTSTTTASLAGTNWTAAEVLLRLGTNQLTITASDAATNRVFDIVTIIRTSTNYVDTTLRTTKATLSLGVTTNTDTLTVAGVFNDTSFIFNPSNDVVDVMFGDYDGSIPSNTLVGLRFKAPASPTNSLTALQFDLKKRSFNFSAAGFTLTNGSPYTIAIGLGTNDLGPDTIAIPATSNGVGKFTWTYGKQLPVVDQFFLGKSKLTTNTFSLAGNLNIIAKPDPRESEVVFGIGAYDENLPTNGWTKSTGNLYSYKTPMGHTGVVQTMTLDFDKGAWKATGTGANLSSLSTNSPVEIRLEIGEFGAIYPSKLIQNGSSFSY